MVTKRTHTLNMAFQANKLMALFPNSIISYNHNKLIWQHTLSPSALSEHYKVKLIYNKNLHPSVYVIDTKLKLHKDSSKLPHVYDNEKQHLCLYYKRTNEWNSSMSIAETIIPWTCEWLFHYEIWVGTGTWRGGGIEH